MKNLMRMLVLATFLIVSQGPVYAITLFDVEDLTTTVTPLELGSRLVGNGNIVSGSVLYTGAPVAAGTFRNGLIDGLGFDEGIILSTGDISFAVGPNRDGLVGMDNSMPGDATLDSLVANGVTLDAAVLEFSFTPPLNVATFRFVFASDEYSENAPADFGDILSFVVDSEDIALVPGTSNPISAQTLNGNLTPLIFRDNLDTFLPRFMTQYDGFSTVLSRTVRMLAGTSSAVRIAIADTGPNSDGDDSIDSAVFVAPVIFHRFLDVPPSGFGFSHVEALAAAGITTGCGADVFCPDSGITRAEMAVFIGKSLGVTTVPACTGTRFSDVNEATVGSAFCGFIEDFAARGITAGCQADDPSTPDVNEARFCPDDQVTRAQMAVFIGKSLGVTTVPACTGTRFSDVNAATVGSAFCGFIEDFAARGITGGCQADDPSTPDVNEARFCPDDQVTRAQMAVFIVIAPPPLLP